VETTVIPLEVSIILLLRQILVGRSWDPRKKTQANVSLQSSFKEIKLEMYTTAQVSVIYLGRKCLEVSIHF
jgi:hypothetical protein